ncbi:MULTISPECIES: TetR/AcrR family transcriptional regulator [unclassified Rhodococcus (in: high G+C Gram-positive bacteria)]|uniref:TetR/AcrR family transcriptional regulator n=1 Tax=unclassified Rhodococcus (in: high G+C Gram-positive bacteria) TaxID=192944 RepID=UPI001EF9FB8E|nr:MULTISPECIES: TetR/AcrR family transcriptional regulator [unclassified Rhodococcus (in: high G+C Gram-positive bacteria)]
MRSATKLFAEQGFRRTSFEDIAADSGISRGSIPWHFGNKTGLLRAVIDAMTTKVDDQLRRASGFDEGIRCMIEVARQPDARLLITLMAEAVEPGSPVHDFYATLQANLRKWMGTWTASIAIPDGVSREDINAILVGTFIGLHQQWRISPDVVDLERGLLALGSIASAIASSVDLKSSG